MSEDHMAARYTAEYMANEYKRDASEWKFKYENLSKLVTSFLNVLPKDRILWYPDISERAKNIIKQMEKDNGREH